uniref:Uncharacterized protein n=1 Tax=Brugia timori TaxID=42155 RepID=A0A0R3Q5K4_9BILA
MPVILTNYCLIILHFAFCIVKYRLFFAESHSLWKFDRYFLVGICVCEP